MLKKLYGNVLSRCNSLYVSNEIVPYVNSFKYLGGIKFLVKKSLTIDVHFINTI